MNLNNERKINEQRSYSIDLLKGVLIILVIIGHVLLGSIESNSIKGFIYSFHMPVFIAVSGYLLNYRWLLDVGFKQVFIKYKNRIIIPWMIALFVYYLFHQVQRDQAQFIDDILREMLFPFYHLWFIPGFISWLLMVRYLGRSKLLMSNIFIISLLLSLVAYIFVKNIFSISFIHSENILIKFLHETIRPYYFVFFVLGIWIKEIKSRIETIGLSNIIILSLVTYFGYVATSDRIAISVLYYLFNFTLIAFVLVKAARDSFPSARWIEWLGVNSMGVYLWHVFPIIVIKYFFSNLDNLQYYLMMAFSISIFFFGYYFLNRIKVVRKLFFGLS
jgi:fucose 4-O-acetylase-like acetyltransferase